MIFSTSQLRPRSRQLLSEFGLIEVSADDKVLATCEFLVAWPSKADKGLLTKMESLVAVQSLRAGVNGIAFEALRPGIRVFSNAGAFSGPVAEGAWGLILGLAKGANVRNRMVIPRLLDGRTLLVLGCGGIGSEIARIGKTAFSMYTIGVSRSFKSPVLFDEKRPMSDLGEVIGRADVIADSLPLTVATSATLRYDVLKMMKQEVILVNVGRAETIDEASIARILSERPETRFGTDVFWREGGRESFDSPLWELPNFAGTFHTGPGVGNEEALGRAELAAVANIRRFILTGDAANEINRNDYLP
jgi:D-3-phosphoglycerate dehydrogenase